jgi:hypothetical protein
MMRCEINELVRSTDQANAMQEGDAVPGLVECLALQAWRANWRPEPDPAQSVEVLSVVLRRTWEAGYAAYRAGTKVMPDLFALERTLAEMWQQGYANAKADVVRDVVGQVKRV